MSTIGDVVNDTDRLVHAFTALLATQTAQEAPAIAAKLGARTQLVGAYQSARKIIGEVEIWVGRAHEVATVADAAVALFSMLPYVAQGVHEAARQGQAEIAALGLDNLTLRTAARQVSDALDEAANALGVAADAADTALDWIDPPTLGELQCSLDRLDAILVQKAESIRTYQGGNTEVPTTLTPAART